MDKQPCHISDEKGDHIQDPADVPDAELNSYTVVIPATCYIIVDCEEQNELEAIAYAADLFTHKDVHDIELNLKDAEVEKNE